MKLTPKQKIFVYEYLVDLNATRAYKKAYPGYKKEETINAAASRMLRNVKVKEYIEERLEQIEDARIAKIEEVMIYLTAAMRGEIDEDVVVVEGSGDGSSTARTVKKQIGAKERNKAAELLGKRYGLFTDKLKVDGNMGVQIIDDIEDDPEEAE